MRKNLGFTIIELLVTIVVMAVIAGFAVPSFKELMISNSVSSTTDQLYEALIYARAEAVKRGQYVAICKSTDKKSCNSSASWTSGWLVFTDKNGNGAIDASDGDSVIRVYGQLKHNVTITYTADSASSSSNVIIFNSQGMCMVGSMSPLKYFGKFTISNPQNTQDDETINLSMMGRAMKG